MLRFAFSQSRRISVPDRRTSSRTGNTGGKRQLGLGLFQCSVTRRTHAIGFFFLSHTLHPPLNTDYTSFHYVNALQACV